MLTTTVPSVEEIAALTRRIVELESTVSAQAIRIGLLEAPPVPPIPTVPPVVVPPVPVDPPPVVVPPVVPPPPVDPPPVVVPPVVVVPPAPNPANKIRITNRSGVALTNYPLQFGRPFMQGEIKHSPQLVINGTPVPTQADVRNRYPDGSVQYAAIGLSVDSVPATGSVDVFFQDQPAPTNVALTKEQMLDPRFDFEAGMALTFPATVDGVPLKSLAKGIYSINAATLEVWKAVTNGALSVVIDGATYQLAGLDFSAAAALSDVVTKLRAAGTAAAMPAYFDITFSDYAPWHSQLVATGKGAAAITTVAPASGTDLTPLLFATGRVDLPRSSQSASARAMLQAGDYRVWMSGPVAQMIELADDTVARKYDLGRGDGYRPFRPRIYATFFPTTGQVQVRFVGENGLTTELEDLGYGLSLTVGNTSPSAVYSADLTGTQATGLKKHWFRSIWTKTFWINGTPEQRVDVDHGAAYLFGTRYFPNHPTDAPIAPAAVTQMAGYWTSVARPNDLYDSSVWVKAMGTTGGRMDIAHMPPWVLYWIRTGDWRLRAMALGLADLACAWPANLRESDPSRNLSRDDPKGAGTGLGRVISITGRPSFYADNLFYSSTRPADRVIVVGPAANSTVSGWIFDGAHQPDPFFGPYVLSGDPHYLAMMYSWGGFSAARYALNSPIASIRDQLRGAAWTVRSRAEAAIAAPDSSAEKRAFTYWTNDAIASWESMFGITGTPFDGTVAKSGKNAYGSGPTLLQNWESMGSLDYIRTEEGINRLQVGVVGTVTDVWQQGFVLTELGRLVELGFAAGPLLLYTGKFFTDLVLKSGHPEILFTYRFPVQWRVTLDAAGKPVPGSGGYMTWDDVVNKAYTAPYLADLATRFDKPFTGESYVHYPMGGIAALVDAGAQDAQPTWDWLQAHAWSRTTTFTGAQAVWNIIPRGDKNSLPPVSTYVPALHAT